MNRRERNIAIVLCAFAGVYGTVKFAWPFLSERLFAIKEENAELRSRAAKLDAKLLDVESARWAYQSLINRTGALDVASVKNAVHTKISALATAAKLGNLRVQPSPASEYRSPGSRKKTRIKQIKFTVNADGTLQTVAGFLKAFYEVPYISRIETMKLDAITGRSRGKKYTLNMRTTIEVLVPPDDPVGLVKADLIVQPDQVVHHRNLDYAMIWKRDPFKEYVPPPVAPVLPPRVVRKPPVSTPPPPPLPVKIGDPEAGNKTIRMALIYGTDERTISELMVVNTGNQTSEYLTVGDELDGGVIRFVHPWGAVTLRKDGNERVYPIKVTLAESLPVDKAVFLYPELVYAYNAAKPTLPALTPPNEGKPSANGSKTSSGGADLSERNPRVPGTKNQGKPAARPPSAGSKTAHPIGKASRKPVATRVKPATAERHPKPSVKSAQEVGKPQPAANVPKKVPAKAKSKPVAGKTPKRTSSPASGRASEKAKNNKSDKKARPKNATQKPAHAKNKTPAAQATAPKKGTSARHAVAGESGLPAFRRTSETTGQALSSYNCVVTGG